MIKLTLKGARVNAGLKQKELADLMGVTRLTIIHWESGEHRPSAEKLERLCMILNVPRDNIILPECIQKV